jgi:chemotaxis protein methyltransferase CheR
MSEVAVTSPLDSADARLVMDFAELIRRACGMSFGEERLTWLHSRLQDAAALEGFSHLADYYRSLLAVASWNHPRFARLAEQIITDKSSWFRYPEHFATLQNFCFPALAESRQAEGGGEIRILSAGCSRGQEPYSIALAIAQTEDLPRGVSWKIDAVDLSGFNVEYTARGEYSEPEMEGLAPALLSRAFEQRGGRWRLRDAFRQGIDVWRHNLLEPLPEKVYDIIFCRNVTIYFQPETTRRVVTHLMDRLRPGGYFFAGHAESYRQMSYPLRLLDVGGSLVYRKMHQTPGRVASA